MSRLKEKFTVRYTEVDTHANLSLQGILKYLQEVGCLHTDLVGIGLKDVEKTHIAWLAIQWKLEIYDYPIWNSKLTVETWPTHTDGIHCYRDYLIYNEKEEVIVKATSTWLVFDTEKNRLRKTPENLNKILDPDSKRNFTEEPKKLKEPEEYDLQKEYTVLRRDIDTNNHVNNINYVTFAYEVLPQEIYENPKFSSVEIMYKHACKLGDKLILCYKKVSDTEHIVAVKQKEDGKLGAIIKFTIAN